MSLRVHVGRDRRDRESSDHPIDTLEREHEAGRQIGPLHIRDRRDRPAASRNEQQSIVRNHLADVRREFLDEPTCVGLAPHRPSQSHGGGLELDQVPVSRCHFTNHAACPDASLTPNDAQHPLAVTDPFFRRRSPADAVRFRPRPHGNAQSPVRLRTARDLTRTRVTGNPRRNCVWRPSVDLACHLPLVSARWTSEVER